MLSDIQSSILCATLLSIPILYKFFSPFLISRSKLPLPPGPPRLPIVGNLFNAPLKLPWETYAKWSKEYNSDIIYLNLLGTSVIVLSSLNATETLLQKRTFSDRLSSVMISELMGWDFNFALMRYGEEWQIHRRLFSGAFSIQESQKYHAQEVEGAHTLLRRLLDSPDEYMEHFRRMAGEFIMSVAYGIDACSSAEYVALAQRALQSFSTASLPGKYLVNRFPILKHVPRWVPGARFKREAEEGRKLARGMYALPFAETRRQMASGAAPPSFTANALSALENSDTNLYYEERHVKATAATMFIGGSDTSVSSLGTFVLAMLANPEAQRKAQLEIDSVTGGKYLPGFADKDGLPYVEALLQEVLRWQNVAPFALPRFLVEEAEYRGYRLPAGSLILPNTWAILHDETTYPDPLTFKPERFLSGGKLNPTVKLPEAAFGFGRRLCPGRHAATSALWIAVVSVLATCEIRKAVDEQGNVIEPSYEYVSGMISSPLPFKCSILPRSPEKEALIRATV
ncbi:cytochrome P450 [Mycena albidolilacea]|uniref:Cytochrome P450 n=1 Tax=Mycena albidolilacea TaxID=1033008 RepID=A0AAD6Z4Q0_9AGAR|nr:cytochrome P450 [Mycena albidolilacea]